MGFDRLGLEGRKTLLVASTGGHLSEMGRIAPTLGLAAGSALVTFDTPQSRAVSWIDDVRYTRYLRPRDATGAARASLYFLKLLRSGDWDTVVSTGAAVAVASLPVAAALGKRSIYIESFARFDAPSTTGRILSRLPAKIELYAQHESWTSPRWRYAGSVVDSVQPNRRDTDGRKKRWFVTLGTIAPYRFDALVDAVLGTAPDEAEIVWQLGCTDRSGLPGRVYEHLDSVSFASEARAADVVVSHAGVGTALELIEMGHRPILVPRRAHRLEHVDDHQVQICESLAERKLIYTCDALDLGKHLIGASGPHFN